MITMQDDFMRELRPLYLQLHTWVKYKLAEYRPAVPEAHPRPLDQQPLVARMGGLSEGADLTPFFKDKTPEWVAKSSEQFYVGLGFRLCPSRSGKNPTSTPVPAGRPAREEHPRLRLARRPRERPALAAEHRGQPLVVLDQSP